jgi:hypothetical protein
MIRIASPSPQNQPQKKPSHQLQSASFRSCTFALSEANQLRGSLSWPCPKDAAAERAEQGKAAGLPLPRYLGDPTWHYSSHNPARVPIQRNPHLTKSISCRSKNSMDSTPRRISSWLPRPTSGPTCHKRMARSERHGRTCGTDLANLPASELRSTLWP